MDDATPTTPLDVPPGVADVVFMGGSFDPPHMGHALLGELARRYVGDGAWLILVPAARSPFKDAGPAASDAQRVEMLNLAVLPNTRVWTDEIDRARPGEPSYTIDTLRRARGWLDGHGNAGARLWLLIGADQAAAFHKWREATAILELARPLVLARDGLDFEKLLSPHWDAKTVSLWQAAVVPTPRLDVSSTALRHAIASGNVSPQRQWLHPAVARFVRKHGLYR